jgi:hypothetical protein
MVHKALSGDLGTMREDKGEFDEIVRVQILSKVADPGNRT